MPSSADPLAAVTDQLSAAGCPLAPDDHDTDLVALGVNSVVLIRVVSALEDAFDTDLDLERLFARPVTASRLASEIVRALTNTFRPA